MPMAESHLFGNDWDERVQAFAQKVDPLNGLGQADAFCQRFREFLERSPSPLELAGQALSGHRSVEFPTDTWRTE